MNVIEVDTERDFYMSAEEAKSTVLSMEYLVSR